MDLQKAFKIETGQIAYDIINLKYNEYYIEWLEEKVRLVYITPH